MLNFLAIYGISILFLTFIDVPWILLVARSFYVNQIGHLMAKVPTLWPAFIFYAVKDEIWKVASSLSAALTTETHMQFNKGKLETQLRHSTQRREKPTCACKEKWNADCHFQYLPKRRARQHSETPAWESSVAMARQRPSPSGVA